MERKSVQMIPRKPIGGVVRKKTADIRVPRAVVGYKPRMNVEHEKSMEKHMVIIETEYVRRVPNKRNKRRSISADSLSREANERRRVVELVPSRREDKQGRPEPRVVVGRANTTAQIRAGVEKGRVNLLARTVPPGEGRRVVMSGGLGAGERQGGIQKVRPRSFRRLSLGDISPSMGDLFAWQRAYSG